MMNSRWILPVTAAAALAVLACAWLAGFATQTAFVWSATIPLEGGWRVLNGQIPHQDFHSPVGYLYLGLIGACMHLFGATPDALTQAAALLYVPAVLWTWVLANRRFSPLLAAATTLLLPLHLVTLTIFGSVGSDGISLGGQYSRISWGLFLIAALALLAPPREGTTPRQRLVEHLVTGVLLGLLFGVKVTYVAGAVGLAGLAWVMGLQRGWTWIVAIAAAALVTVVVGLVATGASLSGYLHDLALVQASRDQSTLMLLHAQVRRIDPTLLALVLIHAVIAWPVLATLPRPRWLGPVPVPVLGAAALLVGGHVLSAMNGTEDTSPVHLPAMLILQAGVERARLGGTLAPPMLVQVRAAGVLVLVLALASWGRMAMPLVKAAVKSGIDRSPVALARDGVATGPWKGHDWMHSSAAVSDPGKLVRFLNNNGDSLLANAWLLQLRSGLEILQQLNAGPSDVVVDLDATNPFPFAAGLGSPKGDHLYWHLGRNVSERTAPPADVLLRDATIVMRPAMPCFVDVAERKSRLYEPWLAAHFRRIDNLSPLWTVWVRPDRP